MEKKRRERIKYWLQIFMLPVYALSFFVPRNKKIWLFGSTFGRRFADNPRYFFLYMSQQVEGIRPVWISAEQDIVDMVTNAGYEAYLKGSLKAIWLCLHAKIYFYDNYPKDISHWLSGGAVKINLWHGLPLKKIQRDNQKDTIRNPQNSWEKWKAFPRRLSDEKSSHYVLTTSEYFKNIFASAFGTNKVIISGYPRCDSFKDDTLTALRTKEEMLAEEKIKKSNYRKMILYMPTFRDSEIQFFDKISIIVLQEFLKVQEYLFCVKLHCKSKLNETFKRIEGEQIIVIDSVADPYVFISYSDMLLTDYSSIYFDYLLTDKPILFFPYDYEAYLQKEREMYFRYDEMTPGYCCLEWNELKEKFKKVLEEKEELFILEKKAKIKKICFQDEEKCGCEQLKNIIVKKIRVQDGGE